MLHGPWRRPNLRKELLSKTNPSLSRSAVVSCSRRLQVFEARNGIAERGDRTHQLQERLALIHSLEEVLVEDFMVMQGGHVN